MSKSLFFLLVLKFLSTVSEAQIPKRNLKNAEKLYELIDFYERKNIKLTDGQPITLHFLRDLKRVFNSKKLNTDSVFFHCDRENIIGSDSIYLLVNSNYYKTTISEDLPLFTSTYGKHELLFYSEIENYIDYSNKESSKFVKWIKKRFPSGKSGIPTWTIVESEKEFRIYESCIPHYPY